MFPLIHSSLPFGTRILNLCVVLCLKYVTFILISKEPILKILSWVLTRTLELCESWGPLEIKLNEFCSTRSFEARGAVLWFASEISSTGLCFQCFPPGALRRWMLPGRNRRLDAGSYRSLLPDL